MVALSILDLNEVPSYLSGWVLIVSLAGFGLVVGLVTAMLGSGGVMVTPLLNAIFGIPYPIAVGSSLPFIIGTSASGLARHARLGNVELRSLLMLSFGSMIGAWGGAQLNVWLEESLRPYGGPGQGWFELLMSGLFIILLLVITWIVAHHGGHEQEKSLLQRLKLGPYIDLPAAGREHLSMPGLLGVGLGVGVLTGLMGIGGGVLFMPLLLTVVGLGIRQAVGTSLGVMLIGATAGSIRHGLAGNASLAVAMSLLAGSVVGVQIGATINQRVHATRIRRYFAFMLLAVTGIVVWRVVWALATNR